MEHASNQQVESPKKLMVLKLTIGQNDPEDLLTTGCRAPPSEGLISRFGWPKNLHFCQVLRTPTAARGGSHVVSTALKPGPPHISGT